MKRLLIACLTYGALLPPAAAAPAGNAAAGEKLHAANCLGCHDTGVYTRKDRKIGSLEALNLQFETCAHMTKKSFTPAEIRDMTTFLNDRFYRFK